MAMLAWGILIGLALQDAKPSQKEIDQAIDTGAEYLKKMQAADGSWPMGPDDLAIHFYKNHMGPQVLGHTAINLLAILVAEVDPDDPSIARGFKFLIDRRSDFAHTYNCALTLMAIEAHAERIMKRDRAKNPRDKNPKSKNYYFRQLPMAERALAEELSVRLYKGQLEDGSWTYGAWSGPVTTGFGQEGHTGIQPGSAPSKPGSAPGPVGNRPPEPPGERMGGDLSNTQYALLGLRSAWELGFRFDPEVWFKALTCMLQRQEKTGPKVNRFDVPAATDEIWGVKKRAPVKGTAVQVGRPEFESRGWGYSKRLSRPEPYGAMTTIGVASLVICKFYLRHYPLMDPKMMERVNASIEDGCAWLATNFNIRDNAPWKDPTVAYKNPKPKIDGYYMYGIERAGVLAGLAHFGEHDWYGLGARVLVDQQQPDGSWSCDMFYEPKREISTCFAILFLKRATHPVIEIGTHSAAEKK
jgi:hypothetical protein